MPTAVVVSNAARHRLSSTTLASVYTSYRRRRRRQLCCYVLPTPSLSLAHLYTFMSYLSWRQTEVDRLPSCCHTTNNNQHIATFTIGPRSVS